MGKRGHPVANAGQRSVSYDSLDGTLPVARTLFVLTLAGLALRLYRLGIQSYWLDEAQSIFVAQLPIGEELYHATYTPPLYYLFLHFLVRMGTNECFLRLPSVLAATGTIPLLYGVGRRFVDTRSALAAALLMTFSPFHLWHSQEVSVYAILLFVYLASLLLSFRYLEKGGWGDLAGATALMGASLCLQYSTVFVMAALNIVVIYELRRDRARLVRWLVCQVFLGLLIGLPLYLTHYLPVLSIWRSSDPFYLKVRPQSYYLILAVPYAFYSFLFGQSFGPPVSALRAHQAMNAIRDYLPVLLAAAVIFGTFLTSGFIFCWKHRRKAFLHLVLFLFVPVSCSLAFSFLNDVPLNPRYLIGVYPFFLLILGLGWYALPIRHSIRLVLRLAAGTMIALALYGYFFDARYSREDARATARHLMRQVGPGDRVIVLSSFFALYPMRFYYADADSIYSFPREERVEEEDATRLLGTLRDAPRIFLVLSRYWENDPEAVLKRSLDVSRQECGSADFPGVQVITYCQRQGLKPGLSTDSSEKPEKDRSGSLPSEEDLNP